MSCVTISMLSFRCSLVHVNFKKCLIDLRHVNLLSPPAARLHVDFKKWQCCCVGFNGQEPQIDIRHGNFFFKIKVVGKA